MSLKLTILIRCLVFSKGIKRNALYNAIHVNTFLWIKNVVCVAMFLDTFDLIINHMKIVKVTKFICWASRKEIFRFGMFGFYFLLIGL